MNYQSFCSPFPRGTNPEIEWTVHLSSWYHFTESVRFWFRSRWVSTEFASEYYGSAHRTRFSWVGGKILLCSNCPTKTHLQRLVSHILFSFWLHSQQIAPPIGFEISVPLIVLMFYIMPYNILAVPRFTQNFTIEDCQFSSLPHA